MRHGLGRFLLALAAACVSCGGGPEIDVTIEEPAERAKPQAPPRPLSDLYGDPLPEGAVARLGTVRFRAGGRLSELAFSPDGRRIAGEAGGTVYLWDPATGTKLGQSRALPGSGYVGDIAFTPRGEIIAANLEGDRVYNQAFEGSFVVRDARGAEIVRLDEDEHNINNRGQVALSPDGGILAIAGDSAGWGVLLVEVSTGRKLMRIPCAKVMPFVAFSADARVIAVGGEEVQVWDLEAGQLIRVFPTSATHVRPVALSRRGDAIAFREGEGPVRLLDVGTGRQLHEMRLKGEWTLCMAFSPDGKALAVASCAFRARQLELLDTASGNTLWRDEAVDLLSLAFSPDGETLAAGDSSSVRMWQVATGVELSPRKGHEGGVTALRFSRDGREIVSGSRVGSVRVWDMTTGKLLRKFGSAGLGVSFGPGPPGLALLSWLDRAELWDVRTGTRVVEVDTPDYYGCGAVVSSTGTIATAGMRKADPSTQVVTEWGRKCKLHVRDRGGEELLTHDMMDITVYSLAFSPDGETLVTGNSDGTVMFLDVRTGEEKAREWAQEGEPWSLTFSQDGTKLATGGYGCEVVSVWDVASKKRLVELAGHKGGPKAVAFSADGSAVATATRDGTVRLWRVETGEELLQFRASDAKVSSLAFSPDGRYLATGSADTTVLVWDLELLRSMERAPEAGRVERERAEGEKAAE